MNLQNFPRISLYNSNPITLLGRGIQCIYEGSFLWLAIATHPLLAGDYYMEDDDYPDPLLGCLHVPSMQIPSEQKSVALPVVTSTSEMTPPHSFDPSLYVAPTLSAVPAAPLCPKPLSATETSVATLPFLTLNVARPSEELLPDYETEHPEAGDLAFLQHWRTSTTGNSDRVPALHDVTERHHISTPSTPPALSAGPSEASTLPPFIPDYKEEQTPQEEPVHLLTLPSLPLEHTSWPEESELCLSPLKSEPSRRRSRKFVHILEPEPRKRRRRHLYEIEKALEQSEQGPLDEGPGLRFHSEYTHPHPYHHHHHNGRHRKSRRKDRSYDWTEADASLEVPFERRNESPPPYLIDRPPTPHSRHIYKLSSPEHHHRHDQISELEEELHDVTEIGAASKAHSPDGRHDSPPLDRLARPPTPHPRLIDLPVIEERYHAEADEFLNRMAEQLFQVEEDRHSLQAGNNGHDTQKRDRKERRRKNKERRSEPYASRSIATLTSLHEYREPSSESGRSKTRKTKGVTASRKTRKRRTSPDVDDLGTSGLGLLLAQPQTTSQQAESSEGALLLGSLVTALPVVQPHLDDGELNILFQGVQLNAGSESGGYQNKNEVTPSTTQLAEVNQQWNDVEDLGNMFTQVQLSNEVPDQERTRPLTIRIPSMTQLRARIVARNPPPME